MSGGYSVKYREEKKTHNGGEDDVEEDDVERLGQCPGYRHRQP
jgi:hypothetical protein